MAGTIYEDFLVKLLPEHTEKTTASILKLIVLITGIVCTALVYVIEMFESVLPTAFTFGGITGGPTVALFTMGMLIPRIKGKVMWKLIEYILVLTINFRRPITDQFLD